MLLCCKGPSSPRRQDSVWSWIVCISATLSTVVVLGMSHCYAVVMPVFLDQFKDTKQKTAWVGSITQCLTFFAAPVAAVFIGRFNFRLAAILGTIACASSLVLTSFAQSLLQMFFTYSLLYGLGSCFSYIACVYAITKYFKKRQALALGILSSGINIGVLSVGPTSQILIDGYGWQMMYRIMAGMIGIVLFMVMTFDPNVEIPRRNEQEPEVQQGPDEDSSSKWHMLMETLKTPAFNIAVVSITLGTLTAFVSYVHLVAYCEEVGIPAQQASNLFIYIGVCSLISGIATGRILDMKTINPFHVHQVAALTMATSMLLLPLATQYKHFVIFAVFLGLGIGSFITLILVLLLVTVKPRLRIVSFPVGQVLSSLGNASGPPFVGFIADLTGSYGPAYFTAGGIMLLAAFIPFLQYCFKPWRVPSQSTDMVTNNDITTTEIGQPISTTVTNASEVASRENPESASNTNTAFTLEDENEGDVFVTKL